MRLDICKVTFVWDGDQRKYIAVLPVPIEARGFVLTGMEVRLKDGSWFCHLVKNGVAEEQAHFGSKDANAVLTFVYGYLERTQELTGQEQGEDHEG